MKRSDYRKFVFIRLLIAAYFIALAGFEVGVNNTTGITSQFQIENALEYIAPALLFATAFRLFLGLYTRTAAQLLAVQVIWSAQMRYFDGQMDFNLLAYYENIALVGALCVFSYLPQPRLFSVFNLRPRKKVVPRRIKPRAQNRNRPSSPQHQATPHRDIAVKNEDTQVVNIFSDFDYEPAA